MVTAVMGILPNCLNTFVIAKYILPLVFAKIVIIWIEKANIRLFLFQILLFSTEQGEPNHTKLYDLHLSIDICPLTMYFLCLVHLNLTAIITCCEFLIQIVIYISRTLIIQSRVIILQTWERIWIIKHVHGFIHRIMPVGHEHLYQFLAHIFFIISICSSVNFIASSIWILPILFQKNTEMLYLCCISIPLQVVQW